MLTFLLSCFPTHVYSCSCGNRGFQALDVEHMVMWAQNDKGGEKSLQTKIIVSHNDKCEKSH